MYKHEKRCPKRQEHRCKRLFENHQMLYQTLHHADTIHEVHCYTICGEMAKPLLPIHSFFYNIEKLRVWDSNIGTFLILWSTLRTQYVA